MSFHKQLYFVFKKKQHLFIEAIHCCNLQNPYLSVNNLTIIDHVLYAQNLK